MQSLFARFIPQAAQKAASVDLQVKSIEGSDGGTGQLSLRVADPTKSKGLVHRHVVLIQQNARQVNPGFSSSSYSVPIV